MACVLNGSHSFTCTPRVHLLLYEPYLPFPTQQELVIYRPWMNGKLSWPGWLVTQQQWKLNLDMVTDPSTNQAQRMACLKSKVNKMLTS